MPKLYKISIIVVILLTSVAVYFTFAAQIKITETDYGFKKTKWGMTRAQVISSEKTLPISITDDFIEYETESGATLYYLFTTNKLTHAMYALGPLTYNTEVSIDYQSEFVKHYKNYKEVFNKKYGDQTTGTDENLGEEGQLIYEASWKTYNTDINLLVSGDVNQLYCGIRYTGI